MHQDSTSNENNELSNGDWEEVPFDEDYPDPDAHLFIIAVFIWLFILLIFFLISLYMIYNFFFVGNPVVRILVIFIAAVFCIFYSRTKLRG